MIVFKRFITSRYLFAAVATNLNQYQYRQTMGAFHLRKKTGNFGGGKSGISDR